MSMQLAQLRRLLKEFPLEAKIWAFDSTVIVLSDDLKMYIEENGSYELFDRQGQRWVKR